MNEINNAEPMKAASTAGVEEILTILFRRKWLIAGFAGLGVLVAGLVFWRTTPTYTSTAKLLVRYVLEDRGATSVGDGSQVRSPDSRGENIINSETEILSSADIALATAREVGPARILAKRGGGSDESAAAAVVNTTFRVEPGRRSNVILLSYSHPDPEVAQAVLRSLIANYLKRHGEIHRDGGKYDEIYQSQTESLRSRLRQLDMDLLAAMTNAGIVNLAADKTALSQQIASIQTEINAAEAELAQRKAEIQDAAKAAATAAPASTAATNTVVPALRAPAEKLEQYRALVTNIEALRAEERRMRGLYTDENPLLKNQLARLAKEQQQRTALEAEFPSLLAEATPDARPAASGESGRQSTAASSYSTTGLQTRLQILRAQLEKFNARADRINEAEGRITEMQLQRTLLDERLKAFTKELEQARFTAALGGSQLSNISQVQEPTVPSSDAKKRLKMTAASFGGCFGFGFILAFALDIFIVPRVRRGEDMQAKLHIEHFITIPERSGVAAGAKRLRGGEGVQPAAEAWSPDSPLASFFEATRDRLIMHFENISHKPKLIGVTGCARGAGATTLAMGLAASLSHTGDGSVLVVDLNTPHGAAHPFYKGKPATGLLEGLEAGGREGARVQENLYLVSAVDGDSGRSLPKRLTNLLPKFRASDYDYIIFDLPMVTSTSVTPRLSSIMDLVLLVVASDQVHPEVGRRAASMLTASGARVAGVLNRGRSYLPKWLKPDF